jgi:hypothetical protein
MADDDTATIDPLGLSDEEFMKLDPSSFDVEEDASESEETESTAGSQDSGSAEEEIESETSDDEENIDDEQDAEDEDSDTDELDDQDEDTLDDDQETESTEDEDESDTETSKKEESDDTDGDTQETEDIDYKGEYERVLKPFKANGKEIKVDNVEDAITLMQMGANYNKKMGALKPQLKIIKMLEKNNLLDQTKLNNLIDLANKDPKAIAQLVKDSEIDPLDIDTRNVDYNPTDHGVTDQEFNISQAIDDIKGHPQYERAIDVMGNQWDSESKNILIENPDIAGVITNHMDNGVYDKVIGIVEKERALGRLNNLPDLVAYRQIVERLQKDGTFVTGDAKPTPPKKDKPKGKVVDKKSDATRNKKRKAASPTKKTSSPKKVDPLDEDMLNMPDDEFMKKYS